MSSISSLRSSMPLAWLAFQDRNSSFHSKLSLKLDALKDAFLTVSLLIREHREPHESCEGLFLWIHILYLHQGCSQRHINRLLCLRSNINSQLDLVQLCFLHRNTHIEDRPAMLVVVGQQLLHKLPLTHPTKFFPICWIKSSR